MKWGGVVSTTVTVNDTVPVLPCESVALHVTIVVPSGNVEPDAGTQTTSAMGPSTSSVAVAETFPPDAVTSPASSIDVPALSSVATGP